MTKLLETEATVRELIDLPGAGPFDAQQWLNYFEENKKIRSTIRFPNNIVMDESIKAPLLRSLQRFQIGETGDGRHLKKFARKIGCPAYLRCVDLFIKEEQEHGQILAEVILNLNGTLLSWHWTDLAFTLLRRMLGLKTEILILLIAEVIGKCFYRCIADKAEDSLLANAFAIIVCDEIAHLRFHSEFLNKQLNTYPWYLKYSLHYVWSMVFYTACFVFILDHKPALKALAVPSVNFMASCSKEFQRSAVCALGMDY